MKFEFETWAFLNLIYKHVIVDDTIIQQTMFTMVSLYCYKVDSVTLLSQVCCSPFFASRSNGPTNTPLRRCQFLVAPRNRCDTVWALRIVEEFPWILGTAVKFIAAEIVAFAILGSRTQAIHCAQPRILLDRTHGPIS